MSDSIQSVSVLSIDEEKLKYRVILSIDAQNSKPQKGRYNFVYPPLEIQITISSVRFTLMLFRVMLSTPPLMI